MLTKPRKLPLSARTGAHTRLRYVVTGALDGAEQMQRCQDLDSAFELAREWVESGLRVKILKETTWSMDR